eukprot:gene1854-2526_t
MFCLSYGRYRACEVYAAPSSNANELVYLILCDSSWTPKPSVFHHHRTSLSAVNRFDGVEYASADKFKFALLFDCDGVIVETEELHRQAYNGAFEAFELKIDDKPVNWSVEYYEKLQNTVGGGKPKMKYHFNTTVNVANLLGGVWPESNLGAAPNTPEAKDALIDALQDKKTEIYKVIVEEVATARPGVLELMDEGLARDDIAMGICSAATLAGFEKVVNSVVGKERLAKFDVILAGDQVPTDDVVVLGAPNPEPVASFQTVIADLDPPDATSHEGGLDAEDSTVVDGMTPAAFASAVHADEDFDFPALREPKSWQLPIICAAAASSLQFQ